jgi:hypothetical protein
LPATKGNNCIIASIIRMVDLMMGPVSTFKTSITWCKIPEETHLQEISDLNMVYLIIASVMRII